MAQMYLYNDYRLPALPYVNRTNYPYVALARRTDGSWRAIFSTKKYIFQSSDSTYRPNGASVVMYDRADNDTAEWEYSGTSAYYYGHDESAFHFVWADYNVLIDSDSSNVFLRSSGIVRADNPTTESADAAAGDVIVAAVAACSDATFSDGWEVIHTSDSMTETAGSHRMYILTRRADTDGPVSLTATQPNAGAMYMELKNLGKYARVSVDQKYVTSFSYAYHSISRPQADLFLWCLYRSRTRSTAPFNNEWNCTQIPARTSPYTTLEDGRMSIIEDVGPACRRNLFPSLTSLTSQEGSPYIIAGLRVDYGAAEDTYSITREALSAFTRSIKAAAGYTDPAALGDLSARINGQLDALAEGKSFFLHTESATKIAANAFKQRAEILGAYCPNVKTVGDYAFYACANMRSAYFPEVTTIGPYAFALASYDSGVMRDINFPNVVSVGNYAFRGRNQLKFHFPKMTNAGKEAFWNCNSLDELNSDVLLSVGEACFEYCHSLKTVDVKVLQSIGKEAFGGCGALATFIIRTGLVATAGTDFLKDTPIAGGTGYIYVPAALVEMYKGTSPWSAYADQIRAIEDYPDVCGNE